MKSVNINKEEEVSQAAEIEFVEKQLNISLPEDYKTKMIVNAVKKHYLFMTMKTAKLNQPSTKISLNILWKLD